MFSAFILNVSNAVSKEPTKYKNRLYLLNQRGKPYNLIALPIRYMTPNEKNEYPSWDPSLRFGYGGSKSNHTCTITNESAPPNSCLLFAILQKAFNIGDINMRPI